MPYDLGDIVTLGFVVQIGGVTTNASSATATVTLPDGTTTTPTITNPTTGNYQVIYQPTQVGRHGVRFVTTGAGAAAHTDVFDVDDPASLPVISLQDAKTYCNITSSANDEELRGFILAASDIAERLTNLTLRRRTYVDVSDGGSNVINLVHSPAQSVTSIVENTTTLTAGDDYTVDLPNGLIYRGSIKNPLTWYAGQQNITITYVAGESNPSPTAQLLVKELTRHLWRTQRGASPMGMAGNDDFIPGGNNVLTYRVKELAELLTTPTVA
jgi:hypothetical protein